MDATPFLVKIADAMAQAKLEAILIGNAGAALQGAPVTTVDFDFFYRITPSNGAKLLFVAELLQATLKQPFPELSSLYRIEGTAFGAFLQVDFISSIHGVSSFNSLRSRANKVEMQGRIVTVASLADIVSSKKAASRPQDLAVMHVLEETLKRAADREAEKAKYESRPGVGASSAGE